MGVVINLIPTGIVNITQGQTGMVIPCNNKYMYVFIFSSTYKGIPAIYTL